MINICIDTKAPIGKIKPLNGVGGGPVTCNFEYDATELFRAAGIPFSRTHDIEYPFGSGEYVDIHCIFPDFDADENDPASYNFILTDEYLKCVEAAGAKPFFRLGSSIEHQPVKRYIYPPKDYAKWGRICSHIIAHYNKGWANGFNMGIEYWEIWNEPDLKNKCWIGSDEEFYEFYSTASKVIKNDHPEIKLGGAGFCGPFDFEDGFLAFVKKSGAPLDFFSWHGYIHTPEQAALFSFRAESLLKKYGFENIESIYDEWNYVVRWDNTIQRSIDLHKTPFCAAFMTSVMSALQNSRTDKAMYYDVQMGMNDWNGVFGTEPMTIHGDTVGIKPLKPYYALKAWHDLTAVGDDQYLATTDNKNAYVTAAGNEKEMYILVSYYNDDAEFGQSKPAEERFWVGINSVKPADIESIRIIDETHCYEEKETSGNEFTLSGNSFALLKVKI